MNKQFEVASKIILSAMIINIVCIILKIQLYFATLSLAVLAYILDTIMDFINDVVALYGTKLAGKPPDYEHPYGHGKYDALISTFIATSVIISALEIFRETINRVISGHEIVFMNDLALQLFIILILIYISLALVEYYFAKKLSIAIMESSALHYVTDPFYTIIVFLSVYLSATGLTIFDIITAIGIAIMIIIGGAQIIRKQTRILLDEAVIPAQDLKKNILNAFPEVIDIHDIKSRTDGINTYLEFHVVLDGDLSLKKAHSVADRIEQYIRESYPYQNIKITIHLEPS